jgi:CheY-like chemotaxis protein
VNAMSFPGRRGKVLVVDDDEAVGRVIARLLASQHDVQVETDCQKALARVGGENEYDVIFCDLMMPGMTGMDFYEAVRASTPETVKRIVFLTGGTFTPNLQHFVQHIANLTIAKPFSADNIRSVASDFVRDASPDDGLQKQN